jgi:hypothetical protein
MRKFMVRRQAICTKAFEKKAWMKPVSSRRSRTWEIMM